jgi:hypothetical protein
LFFAAQAERMAPTAYLNNVRATRSFPHSAIGDIRPPTDEDRSAQRRIGRAACLLTS